MGDVYKVGGGNEKANSESGIRKTVRSILDPPDWVTANYSAR